MTKTVMTCDPRISTFLLEPLFLAAWSLQVFIACNHVIISDSSTAERFLEYVAYTLMEEVLHQLIGSLSHYLRRVLYIPVGCLGFLPSTVAQLANLCPEHVQQLRLNKPSLHFS